MSQAGIEAFMAATMNEAHNRLHPLQQALTYGDHWIRFLDIAERRMEFGFVLTVQEIQELGIQSGQTTEEIVNALRQSREYLDRGFAPSMWYATHMRQGNGGAIHKSHIWPIAESTFKEAEAVGWDYDRLPTTAKIAVNAAFNALRKHVVGNR